MMATNGNKCVQAEEIGEGTFPLHDCKGVRYVIVVVDGCQLNGTIFAFPGKRKN